MVKHKFVSGTLLIATGLAAVLGARQHDLGSLARMGPGYFPMLLGWVLAIIGVLIVVTPDTADEIAADSDGKTVLQRVRPHARAWLAAILGMTAFIVLGIYGGLVPATFALVFISAIGDPKNSITTCLLLSVLVVIFAVAVFHFGMQMQFPLFRWG